MRRYSDHLSAMVQSSSSKLFLFSGLFALLFLIQLGTGNLLFTSKQSGIRKPIITKEDNVEGYWLAQGFILGSSAFALVAGWVVRRRELSED